MKAAFAIPQRPFWFSARLLLLSLCFSAAAPGTRILAKSKPLTWKAIDDALLRVNGEAPKEWSVSEASKKGAKRTDQLLLEFGNRYLLVETHDHRVFEIDPASVKRRADDELLWSPDDRPAQPLPSEWTTEDLGSAFRIAFTLPSQSLAFDLQIEHPPDVGDLPAHPAGTNNTSHRRY